MKGATLADPGRFKDPANRIATTGLTQLGFSGRRAAGVKREAWWWVSSRAAAVRDGSFDLLSGHAVVFGPSGRVELAAVEVPAPPGGQVRVRTTVSALSPGTERARYLGLPHARTAPGYIPGFSAVGEVVDVGEGVDAYRPGDRVVIIDGSHRSIDVVPASRLIAVPAGVSDQHAAFGHLGAIALHGVELADVADGPVAVMGRGVIGVLAQRIAAVSGAATTTLISQTLRRRRSGRPRPDRDLTYQHDADELATVQLPIIIEATGDPDALIAAVGLSSPGGRIVLLGSSRGQERPLPADVLLAKQLTMVGAHIRSADPALNRGGRTAHQQLGAHFLELLAAEALDVEDLIDTVADPREPERLYRRLAGDGSLVGGIFDWRGLDPTSGPRAWTRRPELAGRGIDHGVRPLAAPRAASEVADPPVPGSGPALGLGIVGCGDIAVANAAAATAATGVDLVCCYDPQPSLADGLAASFGGATAPSFEALLERSDVDVVLLCVPHHLHAPLAVQSLAADKHVMVEKPPAHQLADVLAMRAAAADSGRQLTVCLPSRHEPLSRTARWLLDQGAIGGFSGAAITFLTDRPPGYFHGGLSGRSSSDWRTDPDRSGGGVAIMNLTHQLDLLLHLVDRPVSEVVAILAQGESPPGIEDLVSATLRFEGGGIASVQGATSVRGTSHEQFRLWGPDGHLELAPCAQLYSLRYLPGYRTGRWQQLAAVTATDPRRSMFTSFAAAVSRDERPEVTLDDAVELQAVLAAIYRSADLGCAVAPDKLVAEAEA